MSKKLSWLLKGIIAIWILLLFASCSSNNKTTLIHSVTGPATVSPGEIWLSHDNASILFDALYTMSQLTTLTVEKRTFRCERLGPLPD
jgi:hypothetical protein